MPADLGNHAEYSKSRYMNVIALQLRPALRRVGAAIALAAVAACGRGSHQAPSAPLPTVAQIQQRFADAIGGPAAILQPRSMTIRGSNTIYAAHGRRIHAGIVLYLADFKRAEIVTVSHLGRYLSGYDGKIGWSIGPHSAPQVIRGHDAISLRRDSDMYYFAHIGKYFKTMSVVGVESFAGHRCYHLRGTTLWGNENNQYYDVKSGLLTGYRFHQWANGGSEVAQSRQVFERYQRFGKLWFATRETDFKDDKLAGVGRITAVTYDNVNPQLFTPPAAVRTLAAK